jgi:ribose 5-phosphate isomerase A
MSAALQERGLERIAARALELVSEDMVVGLGTGRAATAFIHALGKRVRSGLRIQGVPTSETTARLARELGIPLTRLEDVDIVHLTVDGADEVDPNLDLIKGYGGALVREKIVAAASQREIILVGREKLVGKLGSRGKLPVEILPFAIGLCRRRLMALGCKPELRRNGGGPFLSDSGNYILDCAIAPLDDPQQLENEIRAIPGVVGTGLFLGMTDLVLVAEGDSVRELTRK